MSETKRALRKNALEHDSRVREFYLTIVSTVVAREVSMITTACLSECHRRLTKLTPVLLPGLEKFGIPIEDVMRLANGEHILI